MERWIRGCLVNCEDYHHGETWRRPGEGLPRISARKRAELGEAAPSRARSEQEEEEAAVMCLLGRLKPPVRRKGILPALGWSSEAEAPLPLRDAEHLS